MERIVEQSHRTCAPRRVAGLTRSPGPSSRHATEFAACDMFCHSARTDAALIEPGSRAGTFFARRVGHELVQGPARPARIPGPNHARAVQAVGRHEGRDRGRSGGWPRDFASACSAAHAPHDAACGAPCTMRPVRVRSRLRSLPRHHATCRSLAGSRIRTGLPRLNIALHRLVLVPRAMIAGHARVALFKRLG